MSGKVNASKLFFWCLVLALCVGFAFSAKKVWLRLHGESYKVADGPRTEKPFENFTQYFQRKSFEDGIDDRTYAYFWFQPGGAPYPPGLKFPLVLMLHGAPGNDYAGEYLISQKNQLEFPAFIVAPVLPPAMRWMQPKVFPEYPSYPGFPAALSGLPAAMRLVQKIAAEYPVDTSRIYVIGCSEGGTGAYAAVKEYHDIIAAAVPISGIWTAADASAMTATPFWAFHGAQDTTYDVNVVRRMVGAVHQAGGNANLSVFNDTGHNCPSPQFYTHAMWRWLFNQHK